jgi:hypothetical protein
MQTKLYITDKTSIQITYRNPMFSNQGTASLPLQLPGANAQKLLHPHSLGKRAKTSFAADINFAGTNLFSGKFEIEETTNNDIQGFFASGKGEFASLIKDKYITDFSEKELFTTHDWASPLRFSDITSFTEFYPVKNFVFFPVYMPGTTYETSVFPDCDILNPWDAENEQFNFKAPVYNGNPYQFSPQYYLCHVIKIIFSTLGYSLTENPFENHEDLRQITIFNFNPNHYFGYNDGVETPGHYASFERDLPKILISDFIVALENRFCVKFFFNDKLRQVKILKLADVLTKREYVDVTSKAFKNYSIKHEKITGIRIRQDVSEKYLASVFNEDFTLNGSVENFEDLPDVLLTELGQKYLVKKQEIVYNLIYKDSTHVWQPFCIYFVAYTEGDKPAEIETKSGIVAMYNLHRAPDYSELPRCEEERNADWQKAQFDKLYFLIYRGLHYCIYNPAIQYVVDTFAQAEALTPANNDFLCFVVNTQSLYFYNSALGTLTIDNSTVVKFRCPLASSLIYYVDENGDYKPFSGTTSLNFHGEKGLIQNFWKEYLYWLQNIHREVIVGLDLSVKDIQNIDFSKKIRINNQNYFIKEIPVTFKGRSIKVGEVTLVEA